MHVVGKGAARNCRFGEEKEVVTMLRWRMFLCLLWRVFLCLLCYKEALFSCPRNILVWALRGSSWFRIWSLTGALPPAASITILSFSPVLA